MFVVEFVMTAVVGAVLGVGLYVLLETIAIKHDW